MEALNKLKSELKSVVVSSPYQVDVSTLLRDYQDLMGAPLPLADYGYGDALTFLKELCDDCFILTGPPENPVLILIVPDNLKYIDRLVKNQKVSLKGLLKGKRTSIVKQVVEEKDLPGSASVTEDTVPSTNVKDNSTEDLSNYYESFSYTEEQSYYYESDSSMDEQLKDYECDFNTEEQPDCNESHISTEKVTDIKTNDISTNEFIISNSLISTEKQTDDYEIHSNTQEQVGVHVHDSSTEKQTNTDLNDKSTEVPSTSNGSSMEVPSTSNRNSTEIPSTTNGNSTEVPSSSNGNDNSTEVPSTSNANDNSTEAQTKNVSKGDKNPPSAGGTNTSPNNKSIEKLDANGNKPDSVAIALVKRYLQSLALNDQLVDGNEDDSEHQASPSTGTAVSRLEKMEDLKYEIDDILDEYPYASLGDVVDLYTERYGREVDYSSFGYKDPISIIRYVMHTMRNFPKKLKNFDANAVPPDFVTTTGNEMTSSNDWVREQDLLEVRVTMVHSPTQFWLIRLEPRHRTAIGDIMNEMEQYYKRGDGKYRVMLLSSIKVGLYCAAIYTGVWHRSIVVRLQDNNMVKVLHVDYGTVDVVHARTLRPLLRRWSYLKAQAIPARLHGVVAPRDSSEWTIKKLTNQEKRKDRLRKRHVTSKRRILAKKERRCDGFDSEWPGSFKKNLQCALKFPISWPQASTDAFIQLVHEKPLVALVTAVNIQERKILEVRLIDAKNDEVVCIGTQLILARCALVLEKCVLWVNTRIQTSDRTLPQQSDTAVNDMAQGDAAVNDKTPNNKNTTQGDDAHNHQELRDLLYRLRDWAAQCKQREQAALANAMSDSSSCGSSASTSSSPTPSDWTPRSNRSSSPTWCSSPDSRQLSPGRSQSCPVSRQLSPSRSHSNLGSRQMSSGRSDLSPRHSSPGSRQLSPSPRHSSPGSRQLSPSPRHSSPGSRQLSPGRSQSCPVSRQLSPSCSHSSPDSRQLSPVSRQLSPGSRLLSPGRSHSSLGSSQLSLSPRYSSPGSRQLSPSPCSSSPGRSQSCPVFRQLSSSLSPSSPGSRQLSPCPRYSSPGPSHSSPTPLGLDHSSPTPVGLAHSSSESASSVSRADLSAIYSLKQPDPPIEIGSGEGHDYVGITIPQEYAPTATAPPPATHSNPMRYSIATLKSFDC